MATKPKYDRLAGGNRRTIQLLPDLDQHAVLRQAAAVADLPMTRFILRVALEAAQKILQNSPTRP